MSTEIIEEGNKLIAEFMGYTCDDNGNWKPGKGSYWKEFKIHEFNYHSSWDVLMSVVEKIEALGFTITMQKHQAQVFDNSKKYPESFIIDADFKDTRIENTYDAVFFYKMVSKSNTKQHYKLTN